MRPFVPRHVGIGARGAAVWGALILVVLGVSAILQAADPAEDKQNAAENPLAVARRLYQEGKYDEAQDAYRALPAEAGAAAPLGLARCLAARGDRDKAVATLVEAAKKYPDNAWLPAEQARLALAGGDLKAARQLSTAALAIDKNHALAHLVQADRLTAEGKLTEANAERKLLVDLFNEDPPKDPESLHAIGLAAADYARWNRLSDQFGFLVNDFYTDLLETDPSFWQAHFETGRLFAEKYNQADAGKELNAALTLNLNAAEVQTAVGRQALEAFETSAAESACARALEINPQLLAAHHLRADIHLANFDPRQAFIVLEGALKLNPVSEETLGRMAAVFLSVDGLSQTGEKSRFGKLATEVNARNPHAGVFYLTLADALDRLRRWPAAVDYYQQAIQRMPQLVAPAGQLGMVLMRLGDEDRAKKVLDEAFTIDPFNVRVNNSLKVLEVLDGYATHETEHFRIKYDPQRDPVLAKYMGAWLEEVYPRLVKQMGFAPPEKSLFEVFSKARNTDGHGWFSARMVGLPHIHPIGACAGKIVALQSPSEGPQRFNWARVLKHEFVHVINLQQTDFNIPHWFTEGLAVINEGGARPQAWNDLLIEQSARGKLFDLNTINLGFIRPHSSSEWTLAYCQASLYAQFMLDRFGPDAIAKMLAAYADDLTTPEALERAFKINQPDFELGYQNYLKKLIAGLPKSAAEPELSLGDLQKALAEKPKDARLLAQMAQVQLNRRQYPEARRYADAALAVAPKEALANYVRARLHLLVGENREALERLEGALDRDRPQENLLSLLAGLRLKSEDYASAADLYELGARHNPASSRWLKSLAAVYLKSGDEQRLTPVLTKLADGDPDDLTVRKKLAQLSLAAGDADAAARWALEAIYIQVLDVQSHQWRAEALERLGNAAGAADEYAVAVELDPDDLKLRLAQARMHAKAGAAHKAKTVLDELLKLEPDSPDAKALLESLK